MKENWKKYLIWLAIGIASFILYTVLEDYWTAKGKCEIENYYNNKLTEYVIKTKKGYMEKDRLIEKAVKEKLDAEAEHKNAIRQKDMNFAKYKEKTNLEFREIKLNLSRLKMQNQNLKSDLLDMKALVLSLSVTNKNLLSDWELSDNQMLKNLDTVLKKTAATTEQRYIDFIIKIDKIKKGKKW